MKDGNKIQDLLRNASLFVQLRQTAAAIRDSHDYDLLDNENTRQLAVLCYALQMNQEHGITIASVLADIASGEVLKGDDYLPGYNEKDYTASVVETVKRDIDHLETSVRELQIGGE